MRMTGLVVGAAALGVGLLFLPPSRLPAFPPMAATPPMAAIPPSANEILVYRSESCGCCKKWEDHMRANGFTVKSVVQEDLSGIKTELGVGARLQSCHTGVIQGYVIEGHVPAADVQRLLKEKPKVAGLTAPGMPGAGPGMDSSKDPYEVLTFDAKGATTVWAKH